jgi:hypothetical protein
MAGGYRGHHSSAKIIFAGVYALTAAIHPAQVLADGSIPAIECVRFPLIISFLFPSLHCRMAVNKPKLNN